MMSKKSIVQSDRQRPRAIELMKGIYASHIADPRCGKGENCPMMLNLKSRIEEEERILNSERNSPRSFGLE